MLPFLKQKAFEPLFPTWKCKVERNKSSVNTILSCNRLVNASVPFISLTHEIHFTFLLYDP